MNAETILDNQEIEVTIYSPKEIKKIPYSDYVGESRPFAPTVTWINVDGISDHDRVESILEPFGIHPMIVEDVLVVGQRPKIESYDEYAYIMLKMIYYADEELVFEQLSILFDMETVITIGERNGDVFDGIRKRLENEDSNLRKGKSDHLVYAIVDSIIDAYFDVLEVLGEKIEESEEDLLEHPNIALLTTLRQYKRDLLFLHRAIWPLREVISRMLSDQPKEINKETIPYLRDVYDHVYQSIDTIETYRELLSGMMDLYLSGNSNRMNEIMKVLTIISTIFIPLTFIAGVYGMNFKYMPEIPWIYGYPFALILMSLIAIAMIVYFKRKKWF